MKCLTDEKLVFLSLSPILCFQKACKNSNLSIPNNVITHSPSPSVNTPFQYTIFFNITIIDRVEIGFYIIKYFTSFNYNVRYWSFILLTFIFYILDYTFYSLHFCECFIHCICIILDIFYNYLYFWYLFPSNVFSLNTIV